MPSSTKPNCPTPPTEAERIEAMEYLLGQALLIIEADSVAVRAQLKRLERVVEQLAPGALAPADEEEEAAEPFTLDSLGGWMQLCLERMRAHRAATARQMVAIGELTERVLSLGGSLAETPTPATGPAAQAALEKAQRRPPAA